MTLLYPPSASNQGAPKGSRCFFVVEKQVKTIAKSMARHHKSPHFPPKANLKDCNQFYQEWPNIKFWVKKTNKQSSLLTPVTSSLHPWGMNCGSNPQNFYIFYTFLPMLSAYTKFQWKNTLICACNCSFWYSIWPFDHTPGGGANMISLLHLLVMWWS